MTIQKMPGRAISALAAAAGFFLPAAFGPARANDTRDIERGREGLRTTQAAPGSPGMPGTHALRNAAPATDSALAIGRRVMRGFCRTTASRAGLRNGRDRTITGIASSYGSGFQGRRTSSGERFNMRAMTLACRRLPLGTRVRVTNLRNGMSVIGRVNDIGPNGRFRHTRVADLSTGMARKIGFMDGLTRVRLEVVGR